MSETAPSAPEDRPAPAEPAAIPDDGSDAGAPRARRRRGSRGGRNRNRPRPTNELGSPDPDREPDELPERPIEGHVKDPEVAERVLVRRPQIGDSRPAPAQAPKPRVG